MIRPLTLALMVAAALTTAVAAQAFFALGQSVDFRLFIAEGAALLRGEPLYAGIRALNLNSPALTTLVFAPLAALPYGLAQSLWLAASAVAIVASLRLIFRAYPVTQNQGAAITALLLLNHGTFQALGIGQLTFPVLLYPMTRAWLAYRAGEHRSAGLWLAPAIVAKPPLAIVALLLPAAVWIPAGIVSAAVSASTVAVTGLEPWRAWLTAGAAVDWLRMPFNASLWGFAARAQGVGSMGELAPVTVAVVAILAVILGWQATRQDADRRFLCAGLASVLLSPLGWGYYLPLLIGPIVATWPGSRLAWTAYGLALLPLGDGASHGPILDVVNFAAVAVAWTAWTVPSRERVASQLHGADGTREERAKKPRFANMRA